MSNEQSAAAPQNPPAKKRSGYRWALLASLAVNLFLGGLLIGHVYSDDIAHFFKHRREVNYVVRDLSPQSQTIVRDVLEAHSDRMHALWHELKEQRRKLKGLLDQPRVDEAAAQATFAEMRRIDGLIQAEFHAATLEIARQLPVEERRKLNLRWKRDPQGGRDQGPVRMMPPPRERDGRERDGPHGDRHGDGPPPRDQ